MHDPGLYPGTINQFPASSTYTKKTNLKGGKGEREERRAGSGGEKGGSKIVREREGET